jgi:predicted RNA-binding Zn-ribbon protein involved in translation (DUF1610 family)
MSGSKGPFVLDGNAIAGLLEASFGREMTMAAHNCRDCGETQMIGAHRLYRGAGYVLRCPNCGAEALTVVASGGTVAVTVAGRLVLEDAGDS